MSIENVLYFPKLVDVRFAPKCGLQTIHNAWYKSVGHTAAKKINSYTYVKGGPGNWREHQWWCYGDMLDVPFRKNSVRIAIKRDPVKRFLSCVDHLNRQYHVENASIRPYPKNGYDTLEEVVTSLERGEVFNWHFLSQSFFYGDINRYQYVYDTSTLSSDLLHLEKLVKTKRILKDIHRNKSIKGLSLEVTDDIIERIKTLYRIDYENGWC
jgi:hypothetical protein